MLSDATNDSKHGFLMRSQTDPKATSKPPQNDPKSTLKRPKSTPNTARNRHQHDHKTTHTVMRAAVLQLQA